MRQLMLGINDVVLGLKYWPLWVALGWNDIVQRYKRSVLGPFWLTLSMAILVVATGVIYARLFKQDVNDLIPTLCLGLLIWGLINSFLGEAGTIFTGSESYIKQIRLPFSVYVYRFIWSRVIIFGHNFFVYLAVIIYFKINPGWTALLAIPGLALLVLNGALVSLYLGMISARFRDIPQIVGSAVQILFFVTPVFWKPEMIGLNSLILVLNPLYHFMEIARAPLLGLIPSLQNYLAVGILTIVNFAIAASFFVRFRSRITYWV